MKTENQYIGFHLSEAEYILPILRVREIITMPDITSVPDLPDDVMGVTNLRGTVIPVIDMRRFVHSSGTAPDAGEQVVIVLTVGRHMYGIVVDGITGVVTVNESDITTPDSFLDIDSGKLSGVAKIGERLLIMLNPEALMPFKDQNTESDEVISVREIDEGNVEVTREVETIGGRITVKEIQDAREYYGKHRDSGLYDAKIFDLMVSFMEALSDHDYKKADMLTTEIMSLSQNGIFKEVGRITRNLHNSLNEFKSAVDHGLQRIQKHEIHVAADSLENVVRATEEAANNTMTVVERYFEESNVFSEHLSKITGHDKEVDYFRSFKECLDQDMNQILTAQEFQDITGQTIKRVIGLVSDVENELMQVIKGAGISIAQLDDVANKDTEQLPAQEPPEKMDQSDVEALLKNYGF